MILLEEQAAMRQRQIAKRKGLSWRVNNGQRWNKFGEVRSDGINSPV